VRFDDEAIYELATFLTGRPENVEVVAAWRQRLFPAGGIPTGTDWYGRARCSLRRTGKARPIDLLVTDLPA